MGDSSSEVGKENIGPNKQVNDALCGTIREVVEKMHPENHGSITFSIEHNSSDWLEKSSVTIRPMSRIERAKLETMKAFSFQDGNARSESESNLDKILVKPVHRLEKEKKQSLALGMGYGNLSNKLRHEYTNNGSHCDSLDKVLKACERFPSLKATSSSPSSPTAEDVHEQWETSDIPVVHKIQEYVIHFGETHAALSLKEIRRIGPSFSLPEFLAEVKKMVKPTLNAFIKFVVHYGGSWGTTTPGKIKGSDYKGGRRSSTMEFDGDEFSPTTSKPTRAPVIPTTASDNSLPPGHQFMKSPVKAQPVKSTPVKAYNIIHYPPKKNCPIAYTVNDVVDDWEHVLGSLDPEIFDEVTLGETFTYGDGDGDGDGDALDDRDRSDDEGDKMYEYGSDFGPVLVMLVTNNDEWSAEDEDVEDYNYNPSDSDYSVCGTDDEALDDMEPMVLEEEVQNLEEEIQGSDSNVVRVSTNIFEAEEMAKLARPIVENVFVYDLKPKMSWPTVETCRDFFRNLAIRKKFSYRHMKNDKERLILECKDFNCQWKVSASVTKRDNHTFILRNILRKFLDQHTCEADDENKYAHATSPWVAKTLVDKVRDHPDYKPRDIQKEIFCEFGVSISYWTTWSSRVLMLEKINGNYEVGYAVVLEMCRQIEKSNPGSLVKWRMLSMKSFVHGVVPNVLYIIKKREERYKNYEIRGVPYVHAVVVLKSRREPWSRYCIPYFSAKAFKATYSGYLYTLDNTEDWQKRTLDKELVLAPEVTTQPGRPRKQRIRADDEMPKSKKKCAKCQEEGHNSRSCDARKKGEFGKKKKRKAQVQDGPQMQEQAPPMQEDAPPMQQRKWKKIKLSMCPNRARSKSATGTTPSATTTRGNNRGREGGRERKRSPKGQEPQGNNPGGRGGGARCKRQLSVQEPQAEQPPGRGGRGIGAPVQEVAPMQEPQAPGRGGRGRPRGGRTGRRGNGRGRGRDFYGLLFGDDNVETPSTPLVNANQRAREPLTQ
ncbi:hypothetical protein IFM89_011344 [Coptis chinensis]|uniref:Transposase MuDR plant domain-containing protein n=1 Tax=Coptis chinensis TaxID=261450 RepID=A0A835HPF6_9MAGN|nr:hypothetical protein IFM89_011344 [Coptis chinensis]